MELTFRSANNVSIVTLSGSLMSKDAASVRHQLNDIIMQHSPCLILDLCHLNFIDARGLSVFVSALKKSQQYNGEVLLLNPTPVVRAMLELTRLQQTFSIYADETAAIAHCTQFVNQIT